MIAVGLLLGFLWGCMTPHWNAPFGRSEAAARNDEYQCELEMRLSKGGQHDQELVLGDKRFDENFYGRCLVGRGWRPGEPVYGKGQQPLTYQERGESSGPAAAPAPRSAPQTGWVRQAAASSLECSPATLTLKKDADGWVVAEGCGRRSRCGYRSGIGVCDVDHSAVDPEPDPQPAEWAPTFAK